MKQLVECVVGILESTNVRHVNSGNGEHSVVFKTGRKEHTVHYSDSEGVFRVTHGNDYNNSTRHRDLDDVTSKLQSHGHKAERKHLEPLDHHEDQDRKAQIDKWRKSRGT